MGEIQAIMGDGIGIWMVVEKSMWKWERFSVATFKVFIACLFYFAWLRIFRDPNGGHATGSGLDRS